MKADILVKNVDVTLLREQRDDVLRVINHINNTDDFGNPIRGVEREGMEGLTNLLDHMLDVAEGHVNEDGGPIPNMH